MLGNMGKMISQMQNLGQHLKDVTVEGVAGDGMVKVVMNGQQSILAVRFDQERVADVEPEALGQMITEAFNMAQIQSKSKAREEVSKITGLNLANLPGLF